MGAHALTSTIHTESSKPSGMLDPGTELGKKTLASLRRAHELRELRKRPEWPGS